MDCPRCGEPLLPIERDEGVDEAKGYRLVTCVACGGWWKVKIEDEMRRLAENRRIKP